MLLRNLNTTDQNYAKPASMSRNLSMQHALCWEAQNFFALKEDSPEACSSGAKLRRALSLWLRRSSHLSQAALLSYCNHHVCWLSSYFPRPVAPAKRLQLVCPDPGEVPESEAPRAWWLSSASLASKGLGS